MNNPLMNELPYKIEKSKAMTPFWEGLNENLFRTTKCKKCSTLHYPPSPILCTNCFGTEMEWIDLPLSGVISTWTYVTAPPSGFNQNYILASVVIDILDKPVLGRYIGENPEIGDRVIISFEKIGDQSFIIFTK